MSIFGLLRKKEKKLEVENSIYSTSNNVKEINPDYHKESQNNLSIKEKEMQSQNNQMPSMRQFDILVIEQDEDGKRQKQVTGVFASSPEELQMLYSADGAKIKILREYPVVGANNQNVNMSSFEQNIPNTIKQQLPPQQVSMPSIVASTSSVNGASVQSFSMQPQLIQQLPPKYFEIGGIKCKLENGKMYQEQWVKVDASKYRILSDANNKVISLNGKHIETLKWVLIDDNNNVEGEIENA